MTEIQPLLLEKAQGIGTITLNRPVKFNALNEELLTQLKEALKDLSKDAAIRAVILTGAGQGFCSGQDLSDDALPGNSENRSSQGKVTREQPNPLVLAIRRDSKNRPALGKAVREQYNPLVLAIRRMEKPVIAAVNGAAVGAGASLALMCDFRIASSNAYFVQAFSKIGLIPDSGSTFLLPRLVGVAKAFELMLLANKVTAVEALDMGLINKVVTRDKLMEEAHVLAARLASGATRAFGLTKRAVNRAIFPDLEDLLEYEASLQEIAGQTSDFLEGIAAFKEKRAPNFKGL